MAVVQRIKQAGNETTSEVQMPLYKWNGGSFDILQIVKSYGIEKVTPFSIGNMNYLAVANSKGEDGKLNVLLVVKLK